MDKRRPRKQNLIKTGPTVHESDYGSTKITFNYPENSQITETCIGTACVSLFHTPFAQNKCRYGTYLARHLLDANRNSAKRPHWLFDFKQKCNMSTKFGEKPNIRFHENIFSGSPVV